MDFATIVEAYRWTPDSLPKKLRPGLAHDAEDMPPPPDSDLSSADFHPDNLFTLGDLSDPNVNFSSDRLPSTCIGEALQSDDIRQHGGMLERAKARYESSLSSNWYRPELIARGKVKAKRKPHGNRNNSSAQEITTAADGYYSSSTDIGGGHVMPGVCPLRSRLKPGKAKETPRRGTKAGPSKKRKQQQLSNRPESEDSACRDVLTASWSSDPPIPCDTNERNICRSQVSHVAVEKSASKRRKNGASGIAKDNTKGDVSPAETISRFFPSAPTSILERRSKVSRKKDCRHVDGATDGIVDDIPARGKIIFKKRRKSGASKILLDDVSTVDPLSSNAPAATELERYEGGSWSSVSDISLERVPRKVRSTCAKLGVNALGQRAIANRDWVPPVSVHALIQEELYDDPWKVLVACMLLNKTSGTQMQKVIWDVFALCPTPEAAVAVETEELEEVIRSLGLQRKRACMIQKFSRDYLAKDWKNVKELHGIGKYAIDAYAIFCEGRWREVKPEDHKLVDYWQYLHATDGVGYAFKDDRDKKRHAVI